MWGRDGRRGGSSSAMDVSGEYWTGAAPGMGGGDVVYDASCKNGLTEESVGSVGRSLLSALSIERLTLTFLSNTLHSRLSKCDTFSGAGTGWSRVSRSRRSLSFSCVHLLNRSAHRVQPFWRARISGVIPCLSARSGFAPCWRRMRTTFSCPFAAAKWSGVAPDEPTIGAEVSLCLSLEYLRGSLRGAAERVEDTETAEKKEDAPGSIDIRTALDEEADYEVVPS